MDAIDTNILVYAFDKAYPAKRDVCKELVNSIFEGKRSAVVTNQILAEFAFIITKKIERPLSRDQAASILGAILSSANWKVFDYTAFSLQRCLLSPSHEFWDALIVQTLKEHGIRRIVTENAKDFAGITAINPFLPQN